ncbi:unnamed protein product, partial [Trichogramma brassicae]
MLVQADLGVAQVARPAGVRSYGSLRPYRVVQCLVCVHRPSTNMQTEKRNR